MAMPISDVFKEPAEKFVNDEMVEMQWAMKAFHHAETYFNLITAVDPSCLNLTRNDNEIYTDFRKEFSDLKIDVFNEDELKSEESKKKWRSFCMKFENMPDYHMGTLLRLDCNEDVSEKNTTLVPRIQFLAIEIARNREGLNNGLRQKFKPKKDKDNENKEEQKNS